MLKIIFLFLFSTHLYGLTVLIDPGHGGDDLGAQNGNFAEKNIALSISQKIYDGLELLGHKVFLTRSVDRTLSLQERANLAEKVKADLFVSIHGNSSLEHFSNGFEIYYLGNSDDWAIKKVEKAENIAPTGENFMVQKILIDLVIEQTVPSSKKLATLIYQDVKKNVSKKHGMRMRAIRPGMFYVLALSKRPGVLIETGFVSNKSDLIKLNQKKYQDDLAKSIVRGIDTYIKTSK